MHNLPPELSALLKAFSLGYLLTLLGLAIASLLWRPLRPRLAPRLRASAGFAVFAGTWALNTLLACGIWWGVVSGHILMTTRYFMQLMYGGWSNAIAGTGLMVCGLSLMLLAWNWRRGQVPTQPENDVALGISSGLSIRAARGIQTAALVGVFRPQVWVNAVYWQGLSAAQRELALAHELTHLRRGDNLRKLLLSAVAGLFAVLPGSRAWVAQYELDAELAVDDACRQAHGEARYRELIGTALQYAVELKRPRLAVASGLSSAKVIERLNILARPRVPGSSALAGLLATGICLLAAAPALLLLCHPVPRCLLACYLGY